MSVALAILLVVSFAVSLVLWLAISQETSSPTVVDRRKAERIAGERGGRDPSRSAGSPGRPADDDRTVPDRRVRDETHDRSAGFERSERDG